MAVNAVNPHISMGTTISFVGDMISCINKKKKSDNNL